MSLKFRFLVVFVILSLACNLGAPAQEKDNSPQATAPPPPVRPTATGEVVPLQSTGNTFYVGSSPCDDVGPGSADNPFCSFETALAPLQPGDELVLLDGMYTERLVVDALSGTGGAPVTIRGQSPAGVVFDGGCPAFPCGVGDVPGEWDTETGMVSILDSQHVILRDLTIQNVIAVGVTVEGGSGIWVENVTVRGTGNAGMLFLYTQNLTVAGNDVGEVQLGWSDGGDVQVGAHESLSVVGGGDFGVHDNYIHDSRKEGIDVKESAANGEVTGNYIERTCLVGLYINEAQRVMVRENVVRRAGYFLNAAGQEELCAHEPVFGSLYGQYYGGGIQLAVGDLGDLSTGFLSGVTLLRNVVWDVVGNGIEFWDELEESRQGDGMMTDIQVYHNVVYKTTFAGIRLDDAENVTVANNILALNDEAPFTGDAQETNTITHNLFYPGEGTVGDSPLTGNPLFLDQVGGDFRLQAGSPAIDAGTDVGLPFSGNAPDLGAFEFSVEEGETRTDGAIRLTTPPVGASDQNPALSPDGSKIVFTRFDNGYNDGPAGVFLLDLADFAINRLTPLEDQDNVNLPGSAWNTVANRIVFASDRMEADDLWRVAPDGSDFSRITTHSGPPWYIEPSWSPDGQWIVFEADADLSNDAQQGSIWKVRADGSDLTVLTDGPGGGTDDRQPNWSPAGDRILFQRRIPGSDDWNLYTINPEGGDLQPVTFSPASDTDASWSPDGRWIVYSSDHGGLPVPNLFIIPAEGGEPVRATHDETHEDGAPSWAPDGSWLAFESHSGQDEDTPSALWRIALPALETFLPLVVTSTPAPTGNALSLAQVRYWAYQIQDVSAPGAVDALANSPYDMLVTEPTRTDWSSDDKFFDTQAAVAQLKNSLASDGVHRKLVIAYIDIGEAEDWRWYWDWSTDWDCTGSPPTDWPDFILACDPDGWGGNNPVAYWDPAWKDLIIYGQNTGTHPDREYTSVIDEVINDGFDGIYLDWVEGFENEVVSQTAKTLGLDPAKEMIAFIREMRDYAEARHPGFLIIQQNAAALADGHPELFSVIDAIAQEGVWFDGDATDDWGDPNGYDWVNEEDLTDYYLFHLQSYLDAGLQVFVCEYALSFAADAYANAYAQGYVPYVTRRSLGQLTTTAPPGMP